MEKTRLSDLRLLFRHPVVWVAALGYFVDVYDLVLFGIVRVASLREIGIAEDRLFSAGSELLNLQMIGMLIGGFAFGWMGDRFGRLRTLFLSIFLYSVANLANAFVHDFAAYRMLRFLAGFGLAGELGIAVTLVSESLPIAIRGLGSSLIGVAGFFGALSSVVVASRLDWRFSYAMGGILGFVLLMLRFRTRESPIYARFREKGRGAFASTHGSPARNFRIFRKALACVAIGTPVWFVSGLFLYFAPELGRSLGMDPLPSAGPAIFWAYVGSIFGDILGGFLTQALRSRKRAVGLFLGFAALLTLVFISVLRDRGADVFYAYCAFYGFAIGYWALFVSLSAEQFGTNLRATAATAIPNVVRAMVVPMSAVLPLLTSHLNYHSSVFAIGSFVMLAALFALTRAGETFARDLDYTE